MSYQFEDATPVKMEGVGSKKTPNPFTEVIKAIALKTGNDNKPLAKSFVEYFNESTDGLKRATVINRIKRLMSEAGEQNDPKVTVRVHAVDETDGKGKAVPGKLRITFWTVKRQERPRPVQTATTPQSTAPAEGSK